MTADNPACVPLSTRCLCAILLVGAALGLTSCAYRTYQPQSLDAVAFTARAEIQTMGDLRVSAAVPSPGETEALFGLPLYDRGIQPVWLEVENRTDQVIRFAPVGMDPDYFTPLEVAYTHKKGFSRSDHAKMERYLHRMAMPRTIGAGEVRSGFVFTHVSPGTKAFNVDLFGEAQHDFFFVFFISVPGFVPDHSEVEFESLYSPEQTANYDDSGLYEALSHMVCCSRDRAGNRQGGPLNLVLVGDGDEVLQALLRAGWHETAIDTKVRSGAEMNAQFLFGRTADAVFRASKGGSEGRYELRLWMTPMLGDDQPVWIGGVNYYIGDVLDADHHDPDIDDARNYLLQDLWYSQSLTKYAWLKGPDPTSRGEPRSDFTGTLYFTDGYRAVLWLTGRPVSMLEIEQLEWDPPPPR